jgi:hypothetical protein
MMSALLMLKTDPELFNQLNNLTNIFHNARVFAETTGHFLMEILADFVTILFDFLEHIVAKYTESFGNNHHFAVIALFVPCLVFVTLYDKYKYYQDITSETEDRLNYLNWKITELSKTDAILRKNIKYYDNQINKLNRQFRLLRKEVHEYA